MKNAGQPGEVRITYDADGDRVAKTAGSTTTRYLVDDLNPTGYSQVVEEIVGGTVQRVYTYGSALISQASPPTGATSYYGYDAHGNVTFLTEDKGTVTDTYTYDAYGNLIASTGATPNVYLYGGQRWDADLGAYDLRARSYDPGRGRFLSADTFAGDVTNPISLHKYLYANANPVNLTDPSGMSAAAESGTLAIVALAALGATTTIALHSQYVATGDIARVTSVSAMGMKSACVFYTANTGPVAATVSVATGLPYPFSGCTVAVKEEDNSEPSDQCKKAYAEMKTYCNQPRSCSAQGDTCTSATAKVAAGYGCTSGREWIQKNCFGQSDPGYENHMKEIAKAYETLRKCQLIMADKCSGNRR